jgi:hypothetical protein
VRSKRGLGGRREPKDVKQGSKILKISKNAYRYKFRLQHKQNNEGLEPAVNLKTRQAMYVETLRCVRVTNVAIEKQ